MTGQLETPDYLKLAAEKCGFVREHYVESDIPTNLGNITVLPFFGDMRSQFVLTSLILHRYLSSIKTKKYFILCSHPGLYGLFPYVDEYWAVGDSSAAADLTDKASGFENGSDKDLLFRRSLREWFSDVVTWQDDLNKYYDNGFTKQFFDVFGKVHVALPSLRSLRMDLNRMIATNAGYKVFVHPVKMVKSWHGQHRRSRTDKAFWKDCLSRLLAEGVVPVVWQTASCHDLSIEFAGRAVFFNDKNILDVLASMRACHCVLDVHSGLSRYATVARCPFLCIDERHNYAGLKEFELDDLCVLNKNYKYIYSFITILESRRWDSLLDNIVVKLTEMLPVVNRDAWPTTSEYTAIVPYSVVRKRKIKRLGAHFIKVPKI